MQRSGVRLDQAAVSFALQGLLQRLSDKLRELPDSTKVLQALLDAVVLSTTPPYTVDLWRTQNAFYELQQTLYREKCSACSRAAASPSGRLHGCGCLPSLATGCPFGFHRRQTSNAFAFHRRGFLPIVRADDDPRYPCQNASDTAAPSGSDDAQRRTVLTRRVDEVESLDELFCTACQRFVAPICGGFIRCSTRRSVPVVP